MMSMRYDHLYRIVMVYVVCILIQVSFVPLSSQKRYEFKKKADLGLAIGGVAINTIPFLFPAKKLELTSDVVANLNKNNIPWIDRSSFGKSNRNLGHISDYILGGLALSTITSSFASPKMKQKAMVLFMMGESLGTSMTLVRMSKEYIPRLRPHVYNPSFSLEIKKSWSPYESFFSGHTTMAFTLASYIHHVYPSSPEKKWIAVSSYGLATAVAALRYQSGAHFPTDILTGAGIGVLVGYAIPKFHKVKNNSNLTIFPSRNGIGITFLLDKQKNYTTKTICYEP